MEIQNGHEYLPIHGDCITGRIGKEYKETYKAEKDGIVKISEILDQDGKSICGTRQMVLPKEVFIAAYNAYISDEIKRLEKPNRNWRRKCQRLRNKQEV